MFISVLNTNIRAVYRQRNQAMYPSCLNLTDAQYSICDPTKNNETEPEPIFDEDLEKIVSMTVFVLFGIIFVVGLIGNALVVIGK